MTRRDSGMLRHTVSEQWFIVYSAIPSTRTTDGAYVISITSSSHFGAVFLHTATAREGQFRNPGGGRLRLLWAAVMSRSLSLSLSLDEGEKETPTGAAPACFSYGHGRGVLAVQRLPLSHLK